MNSYKVAIHMKKLNDAQGVETLKATIPAKVAFEKDFEAEKAKEELERFENKYIRLVDNLKCILKLIRSNRRRQGKVLLYWMLGDEIIQFMEHNQNGTFFIENLTTHLVRDAGISDKMINRCIKFRDYHPDISKIEVGRSFDSYVATFEKSYIPATRRR